jgi:N-acetylglucosaminyldiphosphoundecaprenol N-acetyl-beta-D-mannosaminyltransferase
MISDISTIRSQAERCSILGVDISAVDLARAVDTIHRWILTRRQSYVCVTGVHGVMESQSDPQLKRIHNAAGMVVPDGMPMVWISRLRGHRQISRVCGRDLMTGVCEASLRHGWRHFFYGGAEGVADTLARRLGERFSGIRIAGTYCPPFRPLSDEEDRQVVQLINGARPDIVWVGLSTPKQERWMAGHLGKIQAPAMLGVGAAFDFHAGLKRSAPNWMQRSGMEWFYRMCAEPRRLAGRYLTHNPRFLACLLLESLKIRQYRPTA